MKRCADQDLERAEVALGQILEAAPAGGDGGLGGIEGGDGPQQVLVVLDQLQLDGAGQRRLAGQRGRRLGTVAARVDQRLEARGP